jgi:hypothetical protein
MKNGNKEDGWVTLESRMEISQKDRTILEQNNIQSTPYNG